MAVHDQYADFDPTPSVVPFVAVSGKCALYAGLVLPQLQVPGQGHALLHPQRIVSTTGSTV